MDHLKQVRRVSVLPIRESWHATPLFADGTAGKSQRFTEASAAWDWAVTIYPGVPVSIQNKMRRSTSAARQKSIFPRRATP